MKNRAGCDVLACIDEPTVGADTLEPLLAALAEAGQAALAHSLTAKVRNPQHSRGLHASHEPDTSQIIRQAPSQERQEMAFTAATRPS